MLVNIERIDAKYILHISVYELYASNYSTFVGVSH